jgi:hypothetical protein
LYFLLNKKIERKTAMWFIDFILKIVLLILLIDVGVILFSVIAILYLKLTVLLEERKKRKLNNERKNL